MYKIRLLTFSNFDTLTALPNTPSKFGLNTNYYLKIRFITSTQGVSMSPKSTFEIFV